MAMLNFKGKAFVQNYHLTVPFHQLVPDRDKSITIKPKLDDNLIIHGDNLAALKALLPTYAGKVKCIYIDPPYNTGNEKWIYNDNVNSPMIQEWLGKVVDKEDLTRHDKWLCMMMPRLKILRELLADEGVIFISIDDNELHLLRMLMDEVFGENRFLAQITVLSNPKGRVLDQHFARTHDYVVVYAKEDSILDLTLPKTNEQILDEFPDTDDKGQFRPLELRNTHREFGRHNRPNLYYPLYVNPRTKTVRVKKTRGMIKVLPDWEDGFEGCWTWGAKKAENERECLIARQVNGRWKVFRKAYAQDEKGEIVRKKPKTIWDAPEFHTEKGQAILEMIFPGRVFPSPKPIGLIKTIVQIYNDPSAIILDSFGGSGTTAHAVLAQNKEDSGNRRFILIECEDYADKVTAERVRRVIKGIPKAPDETLRKGLGGTFSYFELGKPIEVDCILEGKNLPDYLELARYVFYTATGQDFDEKKVDEKRSFIGSTKEYEVYLLYQPNVEFLKGTALTLERARALGPAKGKRRLVFAPTKYLDQEQLDDLQIDFAQLPFEIYRRAE